MNAAIDQNDKGKYAMRPVTSWLHPQVYAVLIGLALWFVLWIWSFAGAGVTDYLLVIVSGFILVVVALTLILSRVGHKDRAMDTDQANADNKPGVVPRLGGGGLRYIPGPTEGLRSGGAHSFADCGRGFRHDGVWNRVPNCRAWRRVASGRWHNCLFDTA